MLTPSGVTGLSPPNTPWSCIQQDNTRNQEEVDWTYVSVCTCKDIQPCRVTGASGGSCNVSLCENKKSSSVSVQCRVLPPVVWNCRNVFNRTGHFVIYSAACNWQNVQILLNIDVEQLQCSITQHAGFTSIISSNKAVRCWIKWRLFFNYPSCLAEGNKIIIFGIFLSVWREKYNRVDLMQRSEQTRRQSSCLDWTMRIIINLTPELWEGKCDFM